ncbi:MAG: hypothetical protein H8E14_06570 [Candidatus Marinimicrobia bacterium]|nr:hypothetical protein [Candidatus Neomarinimicrobiota bacterium]
MTDTLPLFTAGLGQAPDWCELEFFEIIHSLNTRQEFQRRSPREMLFVGQGNSKIAINSSQILDFKGDFLEFPDSYRSWAIEPGIDQIVIWLGGLWQDPRGGCGVFTLGPSGDAMNKGTPVDYNRNTRFDNHYHDCDEYWIIFQGKGTVVSEQVIYQVAPGDCVATRMGDHHDFPWVNDKIHGVYFETTMRGKQRGGHHWILP